MTANLPCDDRGRAAAVLPATAPSSDEPAGAPIPAKDWVRLLAPFREQHHGRALVELALTALPFAGLWLLMLWSLGVGYWLTLLLAVPTAGFLVRLFMIQHDCGHGSFFRRRWANDWLGRAIGVLTLTPYGYWKRSHATHHATSGNLDRRGTGDIETLTVREFERLPRWRRRLYRLSRHPLVILGLAPTWLFGIQQRLPTDPRRASRADWLSVLGTNLGIAALLGGLTALFGWQAALAVHAPVTLLGATIGVWLFFVQHQFERTAWDEGADWDAHDAALYGSSHYDLPAPLRWLTANIGIHHVHHLASRIPSYRLNEVMRAHPGLRAIGRLTLRDSLGCLRLALWDEERRRLIGFRDLPAAAAATLPEARPAAFSATT
jgi:omega-6 fatty acid desaturase (delta-12 desaturase)